jgi:murein DD-endopeptidase MepM/ murein hydrolase activator NlpD
VGAIAGLVVSVAAMVTSVAPPAPPESPDALADDAVTGSQHTSPTVRRPKYVFPFADHTVTWDDWHAGYPAADVHGCDVDILAPTTGVVTSVREVDTWDPEADEIGTRGGLTVTIVGRDTVRYYFAHLGLVLVEPGQRVLAGDVIGVSGATGNARRSVCHTHFGISRPCVHHETDLLRGEIRPWTFLEAWRRGEPASPRWLKNRKLRLFPDGCDQAATAYQELRSSRAP